VRTFREWNENRVGFMEADLVGRKGGSPSGDCRRSPDAADVKSGWTGPKAMKDRAQLWTYEAIDDIGKSSPSPSRAWTQTRERSP